MTCNQFASERQIYELAQGYNKLIKKSDGNTYLISPFTPLNPDLLKEMTNTVVEDQPAVSKLPVMIPGLKLGNISPIP